MKFKIGDKVVGNPKSYIEEWEQKYIDFVTSGRVATIVTADAVYTLDIIDSLWTDGQLLHASEFVPIKKIKSWLMTQ